MTKANLAGPVGIWSMELRFGDPQASLDAAAELDELGFGAIWMPGAIDGGILADVSRILGVTRRATVATGIVNIWHVTPAQVAKWWASVEDKDKDRLLLGFGVSHAPAIGERYGKPLQSMRDYLDGLDAGGVPADHRCLAALGPKMVDLARTRSLGAHPYLTTPEHSAIARERLGPDALLAPEQGVIVESDPAKARAIGRAALAMYLTFPNYVNNWRRLGFTEEDVTGPSDRLIDALFAWGSVERIAERVKAHFDAGADHVCLQVLHENQPSFAMPLDEWRALAAALVT